MIAAASAGVAGTVSAGAHWHSWSDVRAAATGSPIDPTPVASTTAQASNIHPTSTTVAAAVLAGIVATLAPMLWLVALIFGALFLLSIPTVVYLDRGGWLCAMYAE